MWMIQQPRSKTYMGFWKVIARSFIVRNVWCTTKSFENWNLERGLSAQPFRPPPPRATGLDTASTEPQDLYSPSPPSPKAKGITRGKTQPLPFFPFFFNTKFSNSERVNSDDSCCPILMNSLTVMIYFIEWLRWASAWGPGMQAIAAFGVAPAVARVFQLAKWSRGGRGGSPKELPALLRPAITWPPLLNTSKPLEDQLAFSNVELKA